MQTIEIIEEIERLSLDKKIFVIEETLKSIKKKEVSHQMEWAVNELYSEYKTNKELTEFTSLDYENFYETK
jgi:hypothetical protein